MAKKEKKIVIFGKGEAGKSTLMQTLIPGAVNIDHNGRTVAFDYGILNRGGIKYHFYGTPGQYRFGVIREILSLNVDGIIFVVDGSTGIDRQDMEIFKEVAEVGAPYVVLVNIKMGVDDCIGNADIERLFNVDSSVFKGIVRGSAKDPGSIGELFPKLDSMV